MQISPEAVIFDYGNVLSQGQPPSDIQAMASILDLDSSKFTDAYWRFRVEYDAGSLEACAYWNHVAEAASTSVTSAQISKLVAVDSRSWSHAGPLMPEWARELHDAGLPTAILSNMPAPVRDYVVLCPWLPEFTAQIFSCDVGICKPEAEIYWKCLSKLGLQPSNVLFIDDRESNISAALDIGLYAVKFASPAEAAREIERRFSLPVTAFHKNNC